MRAAIFAVILTCLSAAPAFAQRPLPISRFVLDLRGFTTKLGADPTTASDLGVAATDMPGRAVGGMAGATVYFRRHGARAIGFGAEALLGRGRHQSTDAAGEPTALPVEIRLQGFAGEISLNFGHRSGWSYITAGAGPMRIEPFTGTLAPSVAPAMPLTLNFGGGARWFMQSHLAFCFDFRFFQTKAQATALPIPGRAAKRMLLMSAGFSIR